jgi:HlyD family secretion protein
MTVANLDVFEVEVEVDETEINKIELGQTADIEVDAFPDTTFAGEIVEIGNTAIVSGLGSQDQSTDFNVKVIFMDPNVRIRPGMSATVDIITNRGDDALSIAYSCIVMRSVDLDSLARAEAGEDVVAEEASEETESSSSGVLAAENDGSEDVGEGETEEGEVKEEVKREDVKGVFVIRDSKACFVRIETGIADQQNIQVTTNLAKGDSVISGPYSVLRTIKHGDEVKIIE